MTVTSQVIWNTSSKIWHRSNRKTSNNFAFICKIFYASKILSEVGEYNNIQSHFTYSKTDISKHDIIINNQNYCQKCDVKLTYKDRSLPIMYWFPKLHKTPNGPRFISTSKDCSAKPFSVVISKIFKMLFKHVENFHKRSTFYSSYKISGLWRILFQLLKN